MPGICLINNLNVFEAEIFIPRIGVWHGVFSVDSNTPLVGTAKVQFGSQTLVGTFDRTGQSDTGRVRARIVGGTNKLSSILNPKGYLGVPLRIPLNDALSDASEKLSNLSDASVLSYQLPAFSRMQVSAGTVIRSLMSIAPGTPAWRMLLDGSVWVGYEQWATNKTIDYRLISTEPERGRITISSIDPTILPGTSFSYTAPRASSVTVSKVSYVRHLLTPDLIRTTLYLE